MAPTRYVNGDTRTAGWTVIGEICCPHGHQIRDGFLSIGEDSFRCKHVAPATARECGVLLWAAFLPRLHVCFLAEVDLADLKAIKDHAHAFDTLAFLGVRTWPRPQGARVA